MSIRDIPPVGIVAMTLIGMAKDEGWIQGPWAIQTDDLRTELPLHLPDREDAIKFALGFIGRMNEMTGGDNAGEPLEQFVTFGELFAACYDKLADG